MNMETPAVDAAGREAIIKGLTSPGAPFELAEAMVDGITLPVYRHAPPNLVALIDAARAHGATTFLVEGERRLSYADIFAEADALAAWLVEEAKVRPGDHVAIAMRNGVAWVVSFLAIVRTGAVAVLVNSRGAPAEIRAALDDTRTICALVDDRRAESLHASGWEGRVVTGETWQAAVSSGASAPPAPAVMPDDTACILFTSGTTGRAKGAMLSHRGMVHGVMNGQMAGAIQMQRIVDRYGAAAIPPADQRPQMAGLLVVPLFHIAGVGAALLMHVMVGGKLVIMPRWDTDEALRLIDEERVTALNGVPTMLWDVLRAPRLANSAFASLSAVSTGGQGLALNLLDEIRRAFPRALLGGGWGMTETCGPVSLAMGDDYLARPTSAGFLLPTWRLRVLDEAGAPVATGEIGELAVQGVSMTRGYYGLAQATADAIPDGWMHTGDLGRIDEDGYVFIVDRKTDMVISGGENIYCAEVENVIARLPEATEVTSFGIPDARLGERLVAVVTIAPGSDLDAGRVRAHVAACLADYKVPAEILILTTPMPRNALGKIRKKEMRAHHIEQIAGAAELEAGAR